MLNKFSWLSVQWSNKRSKLNECPKLIPRIPDFRSGGDQMTKNKVVVADSLSTTF